MRNIIDEYLVSIGAELNKSQINESKKALKDLKDAFALIGKAMAGVAAAASAAALGIAGLTAGIIEGGKTFGNITMGVDKFALSLHTSTRNARNLQMVMDAMGIQSLDDLKYTALIPEQRQQFMALRKLASDYAPSKSTQDGLAELRKMGFQFQAFTIKVSALWTEFLGAFGNLLKEPLFKKVPFVLQGLLDLLDLIANEIIIIAKWVGNHRNPQTLAEGIHKKDHDFYKSIQRNIQKKLGIKQDSPSETEMDTGFMGDKIQWWKGNPLFTAGASLFGKESQFQWATKDKDSPAIDAWIQSLGPTGHKFNITSGMAHGGHSPGSKHYKGLALDVGATGKSIKELADLAQAALRSERTKNLNVELIQHYSAFMAELRKRGIANDPRITHDTRYTRGEHLHFGVQPAQVTINVHGAKDPVATGKEVSMRLQHMLNSRAFQPVTT